MQTLRDPHQVSADGSHFFFVSDAPGSKGLYVRINGEETIAISVSHRPGDGAEPKPAEFKWASPDGRYVEFRSDSQLTTDAPPPKGTPGAPGVFYRYDLEVDTSHTESLACARLIASRVSTPGR